MSEKLTEKSPEAKTIRLDYPKKVDGAVTNIITMRPPKFKDRIRASRAAKNQVDIEVLMIADLCEISEEDLGNFEDCDALKLQEAYHSFLGISLPSPIEGLV